MILALDFDGVICDSLGECLETSYRAYRLCETGITLPAIVPAAWRAAFTARRGVVRPSGHYYLLWQWITQYPDRALTPEAFEAMAVTQADAVRAFEHTFHRLRDEYRDAAPQEFVAANPLYPRVAETWPLLPAPRYIVTTKDEPSVRLILEAHGLAVDGVYGRGTGTKPATLRRLAERHGVPVHEVVFVDDNALHLAEAAAVGVTPALALWGYGPRTPESGVALARFSDVLDVWQARSVV